jgi:ubiquinone/menaquinone biosynthesis C-methylase UbiE
MEVRTMSSPALATDELRDIYRRRARHYDVTSRAYALAGYRLDDYRRRGIEALGLKPGSTVVELGCGTGANFAAIEAAIGGAGAIVAVDLSKDMLEQARDRVRQHGWQNVTFVETDVARYDFPQSVDAILSTYALTLVPSYDDVIRRGAEALAPGGRFVVVDFKAPRAWPRLLLQAIVPLLRPFGVTLDLQARHPWESLAKHLNLVVMEERYLGTTYIAAGESRVVRTSKGEAPCP